MGKKDVVHVHTHIHTHIGILFKSGKKTLMIVTTQMDLKEIMLNEISQAGKRNKTKQNHTHKKKNPKNRKRQILHHLYMESKTKNSSSWKQIRKVVSRVGRVGEIGKGWSKI